MLRGKDAVMVQGLEVHVREAVSPGLDHPFRAFCETILVRVF